MSGRLFFIVTNATLYGWRKAIFAAIGNIAGLFCLGVLAVTGLGTLLKASEIVFNAVKYAGAAYLVYLGIRMIFQKQPDSPLNSIGAASTDVSAVKIFIQAFGVAVSNPKAVVFLTALFPQFIDVERALIPQFSMLIGTLMGFSFAFLMTYALLAHTARQWLAGPRRIRAFQRTSGSVLIGFGVLLATSSHR